MALGDHRWVQYGIITYHLWRQLSLQSHALLFNAWRALPVRASSLRLFAFKCRSGSNPDLNLSQAWPIKTLVSFPQSRSSFFLKVSAMSLFCWFTGGFYNMIGLGANLRFARICHGRIDSNFFCRFGVKTFRND
mgnify:CR=1 FL=1